MIYWYTGNNNGSGGGRWSDAMSNCDQDMSQGYAGHRDACFGYEGDDDAHFNYGPSYYDRGMMVIFNDFTEDDLI